MQARLCPHCGVDAHEAQCDSRGVASKTYGRNHASLLTALSQDFDDLEPDELVAVTFLTERLARKVDATRVRSYREAIRAALNGGETIRRSSFGCELSASVALFEETGDRFWTDFNRKCAERRKELDGEVPAKPDPAHKDNVWTAHIERAQANGAVSAQDIRRAIFRELNTAPTTKTILKLLDRARKERAKESLDND